MWMSYTIVARAHEEPASKARRLVLTSKGKRYMKKWLAATSGTERF